MTDKEQSVQHYLDLAKRAGRGKFKIYIGMSAGVGKTYRMLQEAHAMLRNGINIQIGYIETHGRAETHALLEGLPASGSVSLESVIARLAVVERLICRDEHPEGHALIAGARRDLVAMARGRSQSSPAGTPTGAAVGFSFGNDQPGFEDGQHG